MSRFDDYVNSNDTPKTLCKEIEELKDLIFKLKVCGNCKYWCYRMREEDYICIRTKKIENSMECYKSKMCSCSAWEFDTNE